MKKQNASKLAFNKAAITELNDTMLHGVHGGRIPTTVNGGGNTVMQTTIGDEPFSGCCCVNISIKVSIPA